MRCLITIEIEELSEIIKRATLLAIKEHEEEKKKFSNMKLLTINQVAKKLAKSRYVIIKMIKKGVLSATKDNQIPEVNVEKYIRTVHHI